jgi:hypothetical protein
MKRACALRQCLNLRELSLSSSQKGGSSSSSSGAGASFAHYPRFVNEEDLSDGDESDFVPEDETLMVDFVLEHTDVAEETVPVADAHVPLSNVDLPPAPVAISTAAYEKILKSGKTLPEILRTRWTDVAIKQLAKWRRKDTYGYFHAPVPLEYVPDYLTVIKTPMDFGTMETRLDERLYADYEAFASDFRLICQNAMLYNGPKSPYHKVAKSLLGVGNRAITAAIARQDIYTTRLTQEKKEYDRIAE